MDVSTLVKVSVDSLLIVLVMVVVKYSSIIVVVVVIHASMHTSESR